MLTQSELQWLEDRKKKCYTCNSYFGKCTHWKVAETGKEPINLKTNKCKCFSSRYYYWPHHEDFLCYVIENVVRQTPNPFEVLKKAYIEADEHFKY